MECDMMKPATKIVIGALLVIAGIYWYVAGGIGGNSFGWSNLMAFVTILKGSIGVLVFLIGAFIVWLEADELRMERELSTEFEEEDFDIEEPEPEVETESEQEEVKQAVASGAEEAEGDYVCDICGKSFDTERGLAIHKGRAHEE